MTTPTPDQDRIGRLKSLLLMVEEQNTLVREEADKNRDYELTDTQLNLIDGLFTEIRHLDIWILFQHDRRPDAVRAQIRVASGQGSGRDPEPPVTQGPSSYGFHPEIERVSARVFRDGHYREAALNAYIRVIEEVKVRSDLPLDGDRLMNRAFGCDNQTPVIRVNSLSSEAEIDEQRAFLNLFKGIVGLRNLKAHSLVLLDDPDRAREYLALASLLMRILEISTVNSI
jgi:uncharacterized protein (TIGR02391 family)